MDSKGSPATGRCVGHCYRFDSIVVDVLAHTLSRDGELQAVEPKAFAVLLFLLEHAGELVHHGDLLDAVWGHRHVTAGVLTRAIAQLRHVLNDDSQHPRYIQTQHGLGYRFIGELRVQPDTGEASAASTATPQAAAEPARIPTTQPDDQAASPAAGEKTGVPLLPARPAFRSSTFSRRLWLVVALLAAAALAAWLWFRSGPSSRAPPAAASIAVLPFASPGAAADGTVSRRLSRCSRAMPWPPASRI